MRLCFVDLRFFVALGKSYIKSVGLHVSALNKDHTFFVSSNWAEGKDLYEMEERRVIARDKIKQTKLAFMLGTFSILRLYERYVYLFLISKDEAYHCSTGESDVIIHKSSQLEMLPVEFPTRLLDELSEAYCNKYRLVLCSFSNYLILSILMSKLRDRADLREKLRTVFAGGVVDFVTLLSWRDEFHRARATLALHGADVGRLVRQVTGRSQRVVEQLDPEKSSPQSTARDPIQ